MPLLEIAAAQPAFQSHLGTLRYQTLFHGKVFSSSFTVENENRLTCPWKSLDTHKRVNFSKMPWRRLLIKAVATLEPKSVIQNEYEYKGSQLGIDSNYRPVELPSSSEDPNGLNERERLRRMRISKANKGNTAWNKGRKHSPETLQRIRERTKLAMQDPKVRMKLVTFGHAQSDETKLKIGVGVRTGWQRRREKLMLQEMCYFEWLNLISEASRRGYVDDEDELQWESYKILKEQFEKEWTESVEERKKMPKLKGTRRGPKSPEQRRKISEAISAKWTNPDYRKRVWSGQAKYHGIPEGAERKPRRRISGSTQSTSRGLIKKKAIRDYYFESETTTQNQQTRLRRNAPLYKDPLVSSKLEMIKNIRAQRAASETKKTEAVERARMLIAEAEKAANALEVAATKSPIAQASLVETRKLIAEAIRSLEYTETGQITSHETNGYPSALSSEPLNQTQNQEHREVNGTKSLSRSDNEDFDFGKLTFQEFLNGEEELLPTSSSDIESGLHPLNGNTQCRKNPIPNGAKVKYTQEQTPSKPVTKKWVCGRLVEVTE